MSEAIAAWTEAFAKAQAQLVNPPKSKTVSTGRYSYSYAELPDIIDSVRIVLAEHGMSFAQALVSDTHSGDGRVGCITRVYHAAGHHETFGPLYLPAGSTAQEAGSAATYARRYSLCAALGIAAEEDDDGAAASKKKSGSPATRTAADDPIPSGQGTRTPTSAPDRESTVSATGGGGEDQRGTVGKRDAQANPTSSNHKPGCAMTSVTDLKPDGSQMPKGKLRCTDCGVVLREEDVL